MRGDELEEQLIEGRVAGRKQDQPSIYKIKKFTFNKFGWDLEHTWEGGMVAWMTQENEARFAIQNLINQSFSKYSQQTGPSSISWELGRNVDSDSRILRWGFYNSRRLLYIHFQSLIINYIQSLFFILQTTRRWV